MNLETIVEALTEEQCQAFQNELKRYEKDKQALLFSTLRTQLFSSKGLDKEAQCKVLYPNSNETFEADLKKLTSLKYYLRKGLLKFLAVRAAIEHMDKDELFLEEWILKAVEAQKSLDPDLKVYYDLIAKAEKNGKYSLAIEIIRNALVRLTWNYSLTAEHIKDALKLVKQRSEILKKQYVTEARYHEYASTTFNKYLFGWGEAGELTIPLLNETYTIDYKNAGTLYSDVYFLLTKSACESEIENMITSFEEVLTAIDAIKADGGKADREEIMVLSALAFNYYITKQYSASLIATKRLLKVLDGKKSGVAYLNYVLVQLHLSEYQDALDFYHHHKDEFNELENMDMILATAHVFNNNPNLAMKYLNKPFRSQNPVFKYNHYLLLSAVWFQMQEYEEAYKTIKAGTAAYSKEKQDATDLDYGVLLRTMKSYIDYYLSPNKTANKLKKLHSLISGFDNDTRAYVDTHLLVIWLRKQIVQLSS